MNKRDHFSVPITQIESFAVSQLWDMDMFPCITKVHLHLFWSVSQVVQESKHQSKSQVSPSPPSSFDLESCNSSSELKFNVNIKKKYIYIYLFYNICSNIYIYITYLEKHRPTQIYKMAISSSKALVCQKLLSATKRLLLIRVVLVLFVFLVLLIFLVLLLLVV